MSKERIIEIVKRKMGEPILKHLTDEDYNKCYTLSERILTETKLEKEWGDSVNKVLHRKIMEVLCKDLIENKDELDNIY